METIKNLSDLCTLFGADDPRGLNHRIYENTDCGASISVHVGKIEKFKEVFTVLFHQGSTRKISPLVLGKPLPLSLKEFLCLDGDFPFNRLGCLEKELAKFKEREIKHFSDIICVKRIFWNGKDLITDIEVEWSNDQSKWLHDERNGESS